MQRLTAAKLTRSTQMKETLCLLVAKSCISCCSRSSRWIWELRIRLRLGLLLTPKNQCRINVLL
jgi:hypothetical protein